MSDLQNSRRAPPGQPLGVFIAHLAGLAVAAALPFALTHAGFPFADFLGVALGCLAWATVAALESWIQPVAPATVAADDTPWRKTALAALVALPFAAALDSAFHPATLLAGAALLALGGGLRVWSLAALGDRFTWTAGVVADHTIVRDGPYRYLKHPNYAGNAVFAAGIALAAGSTFAWALVAVLAVAVIFAARHEADFLRRNLPGYDVRR